MEIEVYPKTIREFLPITIHISHTNMTGEAKLKVSPVSSDIQHLTPFTLPLLEKEGQWEASFWLQKAGTYKMEVSGPEGSETRLLEVHPQIFLDFSSEFGMFGVSFLIASSLLILWFVKKRRVRGA